MSRLALVAVAALMGLALLLLAGDPGGVVGQASGAGPVVEGGPPIPAGTWDVPPGLTAPARRRAEAGESAMLPGTERDPTIPPGRARLVVELWGAGRGVGGCSVKVAEPAVANLEVRGGGGRVGVSDERGRVPFFVEPGVTVSMDVAPVGTAETERWSTNTPAEGRTKVFKVAVPDTVLRPYVLAVVDRGSGQAIAGASVAVEHHDASGSELRTPADGSGTARLLLPQWGKMTVSAPGYRAREFTIEPDGPTPTGVVCLARSASLHGAVPASLLGNGHLQVHAVAVVGEGESRVKDRGWPAEGEDAPPPPAPDGRPRPLSLYCDVDDRGLWAIRGIELEPHASHLRVERVVLVGREKAAVLATEVELAPGEQRLVLSEPGLVLDRDRREALGKRWLRARRAEEVVDPFRGLNAPESGESR